MLLEKVVPVIVEKWPRTVVHLSTMSEGRGSDSWKSTEGCKKEKMCTIRSSGSGSGQSIAPAGRRSSRQSHASRLPWLVLRLLLPAGSSSG